MAVVADSGAIYALYDLDDRHHRSVTAAVKRERGPVVIPSVISVEVDYLLREFLGIDAELDFVDALISGGFALEPPAASDLKRCRELIEQYRSLDLGLADATVIATAERLGIERILTIDERHFRAVRPHSGRSFVLLPRDG